MSLLGFTFGFGARDEGMDNAMNNANSHLDSLDKAMESLDETAKNSGISTWLDALQNVQLSGLQSSLDEITGGAQNLTNGLEATFHSMRREVAPAIAQMGLYGAEADAASSRISSVAHSAQLGAGQVASTFRALSGASDRAKAVFDNMGLGLSELAALEQTTGISTEQLAAQVENLTNSYGFSADSASDFLDQFTAQAQAAGVAHVAFGSLEGMLGQLDTQLAGSSWFAKMDPAAQAAHIQEVTLGITQMSGLFQRMGKTPEQAIASSQAFFTTLSDGDKMMSRMSTGLGDMNDNFLAVAESAGLEVSSDLFKSDPRKALQNLVEIREKMKDAGKDTSRFDQQMDQIMPGFAFMAEGLGNNTISLEDFAANTDEAAGALSRMGAAGHNSEKTLSESFQIIQDKFESRLFKIGGGGKNFVAQQKAVYQSAGDAIQKMASDETWGPLVQRFSLAARLGNAAFFLPIQHSSFRTTTQLNKVGDATGFMGKKFEALRQFGIAGLFVDVSGGVDQMKASLGKANAETARMAGILELVKVNMKTFMPVLGALAAAIFAVGKVLPTVMNALKALSLVFGSVGTAIVAFFGWPLIIIAAVAALVVGLVKYKDEIGDIMKKIFGYLTGWADKASQFFESLDGEKIGRAIVEWVKNIPRAVASFFDAGGGDNELGTAASAFGQSLLDMMISAFTVLVDIGAELGRALAGIDWEGGLQSASAALSDAVMAFPAKALSGVRHAYVWVDAMMPKIDDVGKSIGDWFGSLAGKLESFFANLFSSQTEGDSFWDNFDWGAMLEAAFLATLTVGRVLATIQGVFVNVAAGLGTVALVLLNGLVDSIQAVFTSLKNVVLGFAGFLIDPVFRALGFEDFKLAYWFNKYAWDPLMELIDSLQAVISAALHLVFIAPFNFIKSIWNGEMSIAGAFVEHIWKPFVNFLSSIGAYLFNVLDYIYLRPIRFLIEAFLAIGSASLSAFIDYLWTPFVDFLGGIAGFIGDAFDFIFIAPLRAVWDFFAGGDLSLGKAFADYVWNPLVSFMGMVGNTMKKFFNLVVLDPLQSSINLMIGMANKVIKWIPGLSRIPEIDISFDVSDPSDQIGEAMAFEQPEAPARAAGAAMGDGLSAGIEAARSQVQQSTRDMAQGTMDVLPQSPPADPNSPLHGLEESGTTAGMQWAQGFIVAIPHMQVVIGAAFGAVFGAIAEAILLPIAETTQSIGRAIISHIAIGMASEADMLISMVQSIFTLAGVRANEAMTLGIQASLPRMYGELRMEYSSAFGGLGHISSSAFANQAVRSMDRRVGGLAQQFANLITAGVRRIESSDVSVTASRGGPRAAVSTHGSVLARIAKNTGDTNTKLDNIYRRLGSPAPGAAAPPAPVRVR